MYSTVIWMCTPRTKLAVYFSSLLTLATSTRTEPTIVGKGCSWEIASVVLVLNPSAIDVQRLAKAPEGFKFPRYKNMTLQPH